MAFACIPLEGTWLLPALEGTWPLPVLEGTWLLHALQEKVRGFCLHYIRRYVANVVSRAVPQNKPGHRVRRYKRFMLIPVVKAHKIQLCSKTRVFVCLLLFCLDGGGGEGRLL